MEYTLNMVLFLFVLTFRNLDAGMLKLIYENRIPSWDPFFIWISNFAALVAFGIPVVLALISFVKKKPAVHLDAINILISVALSALVANIMKYTICLPRPNEIYAFIENLSTSGSPSFPSGHTADAFAFAVALSLIYRKWHIVIPAFTWAFLIGYSRMRLGVHFPSDVFAGALVGISIAFAGNKNGGFVSLIKRFYNSVSNKPAITIGLLLFLQFAFLVYTNGFGFASRDFLIKLPLFLFPLFLAARPKINPGLFIRILTCFITAVFAGSIYRMVLLLNLPADTPISVLQASDGRYTLHTVFALFGIFFILHSQGAANTLLKIFLIATGTFLVVFMVILNLSSGILIFITLVLLLLLFYIVQIKALYPKIASVALWIVCLVLPFFYFLFAGFQFLNTPPVEFSKLEKHTLSGNSYYHDTVNFKAENGKWAGLYICDKELRQAWAERSKLPLDSLDHKKHMIRNTVINYLASKDLRKDSAGISQLSAADIQNIENGISRYDFNRVPGFMIQFENFSARYQRYLNLDNQKAGSFGTRIAAWFSSVKLIAQQHRNSNGLSVLPAMYNDPHYNSGNGNRTGSARPFPAVLVTFGFIGLAWFVIALLYPGNRTIKYNQYLYAIFWIVFSLSLLIENTAGILESVLFYILIAIPLIGGRNEA